MKTDYDKIVDEILEIMHQPLDILALANKFEYMVEGGFINGLDDVVFDVTDGVITCTVKLAPVIHNIDLSFIFERDFADGLSDAEKEIGESDEI